MPTTSEVRAALRVARGADMLDSRIPGWAERIDVERLDLADGRVCILGQLCANDAFGCCGWCNGIDDLFADDGRDDDGNTPTDYGLETSGEHVTYRDLTVAWTREVMARTAG